MHKCVKYSDDGIGIHIVKNIMLIYGFDDMRIDEIKINHCPFCGMCFQPDSSKREDHESGCGARNTVEMS